MLFLAERLFWFHDRAAEALLHLVGNSTVPVALDTVKPRLDQYSGLNMYKFQYGPGVRRVTSAAKDLRQKRKSFWLGF